MKLLYKHNNIVKIIIIIMIVLKLWSKQFFKFDLCFDFLLLLRSTISFQCLLKSSKADLHRERGTNRKFSPAKKTVSPKYFFDLRRLQRLSHGFCCSSIRPWQRTKYLKRLDESSFDLWWQSSFPSCGSFSCISRWGQQKKVLIKKSFFPQFFFLTFHRFTSDLFRVVVYKLE